MFPYLSAVMPQIAYAHSVRDFIRELLRRFIPGKWIDRVISNQDANFDAKLDAAFAGLDEKTANEKDYCAKVVSVLCDEVSSVCEVTRLVCINRGYRKYADTFLSSEKFIRLLLRQDVEKLERLTATLAEKSKPLCILLRDVGAVLEDRPAEDVASFGAAEVRKANAEIKAIAADVKETMQTGFAEVRGDIAAVGEKVGAVAAKISKLRKNGKPRGRYSQEARDICWNYWITAENHEEVWRSVNTRITFDTVFEHYKIQLARVEVKSSKDFEKIIRARNRQRSRAISTKHRCTSAAHATPRNGIMSDMKNRAKSALALTLAIAGVLAAPLRSDASPDILRGGGGCYPQGCVAALYAPPSAIAASYGRTEDGASPCASNPNASNPNASQSKEMRHLAASLTGRVTRVADGDTLTILDAANAQHKIRLYAIDAPEKAQAFGTASKQHLSSLVFGKDVRVTYAKRDKYGRILGTVFVDGNDINLAMLQAGYAWHYKRFDSTPAYAAAESEARQNRHGLWSDPNPTPPEDFRHGKTAASSKHTEDGASPCVSNPAASHPKEMRHLAASSKRVEYRAGSALPVSSRTAAPINDTYPDTGYWLTTNSNKRHNRKCENYRKTRGYPCSSSDGTPCGKCGG